MSDENEKQFGCTWLVVSFFVFALLAMAVGGYCDGIYNPKQ